MTYRKAKDGGRENRNGKKIFVVCLILVMLAGTFVGCGNGGACDHSG